jgi:hypothetical protein
MKRYNLFMETEKLEELKQRAEKESSTVSELIRQAVEKMLASPNEVVELRD